MTRNIYLLKIGSVQEKCVWKCIWFSPFESPTWWNSGIQICTDFVVCISRSLRNLWRDYWIWDIQIGLHSFPCSIDKQTWQWSKGSQLKIPVQRLVNITILITTVVLDTWVSFSSTKKFPRKMMCYLNLGKSVCFKNWLLPKLKTSFDQNCVDTWLPRISSPSFAI